MIKLKPIELMPLADDFKLREVQEISKDMLMKSYKTGNKRTIVHASTAAGKTIFSGFIFREVFKKRPESQCWFIVPRITLIEQTKLEFEKHFGFDCGIVQGDSEVDLSKHVQISTIQTLINRINSTKPYVHSVFNSLNIGIVAIDEAHLQYAGHTGLNDTYEPYMFGLTATPFSKGLGVLWQDMVRPKKMAELMEDGTIADYRVKCCISIDRSNLKTKSTGEFNDKDVERETGQIIGDVYDEWHKSDDMKGRPFLGFTQTIASTIALSELFNSKGAKTAFIHSKMSDEDVENTLSAFKNGFYDGVFSVAKLIEGFNFPEASALIDCAPMAASKDDPNIPNAACRYVQKHGRVVRSHKDKNYALIHCHAGNYLNFIAPEFIEDFFTELDDGKKQEPKQIEPAERKELAQRECSGCGMIIRTAICNICGAKAKKPTQFLQAGDLDFIDGEMVEIRKEKTTKEKAKKREISKIDFARQLKSYCNNVKFKDPKRNVLKIFLAKYKAYHGVWPRGDMNFDRVKPMVESAGFSSWIKSQNIRYAKSKSKDDA